MSLSISSLVPRPSLSLNTQHFVYVALVCREEGPGNEAKQYLHLAIYSYAQTLLVPVGSPFDKNEHVCQTFAAAPPTCTHGPHEDRTHTVSALHVPIPHSILCSILVPCRADIVSFLSVICLQLQLRNSVHNKMCGEAGAVDQMSRDSRNLEVAPPQMDSLLDYGHKY